MNRELKEQGSPMRKSSSSGNDPDRAGIGGVEAALRKAIGFDTDDFGAALYASFWNRNEGVTDPPAWGDQAQAIRKMWRGIALDAARYLLADAALQLDNEPGVSDATGWRTIDSAPRDGTEIIGGWVDPAWVYAIWWRGEDSDAGWWFANEGPGDYNDELICPQPTHWMPLPEPPHV
jgi:hypothetical protein